MTRSYRYLLVLALLILVILGLNTSNQGINSLTMEARKPVIGLQTEGDKVSIFTLGESHVVTRQGVVTAMASVKGQVQNYAQTGSNYLKRTFVIVKALLSGSHTDLFSESSFDWV